MEKKLLKSWYVPFFFCVCEKDFSLHYLQSDQVSIGVSFNVLENLQTISLGEVSFALPENLLDLQESLGGVGQCAQVGYSLLDPRNEGDLFFYIYLLK